MDTAEWRPILATLALPPAAPLLLAAAGWLLARRWRAAGRTLGIAGLALLWLLSCNGVAVQLSRTLLPQVAALAPAQAPSLRGQGIQAVIALGGGLHPRVPELEGPQPSSYTGTRALYAAWLARESGLPMGFAGGVGWANAGAADHPNEADAVARLLGRTGLAPLRWADAASRDTIENARNMAALLQRDGITRIALVTSAWHMPRSVRAFEAAGLQVLPAPMGFVTPLQRPLLEWLPSSHGLSNSHNVLREWLAWRMGR